MLINDLIKGNKKFREARFPKYEDDLKQLVETGQKPEVLFIGCSDSRVTPDLMLDTKPGDMFILRNVGNFVPHIILMMIIMEVQQQLNTLFLF